MEMEIIKKILISKLKQKVRKFYFLRSNDIL